MYNYSESLERSSWARGVGAYEPWCGKIAGQERAPSFTVASRGARRSLASGLGYSKFESILDCLGGVKFRDHVLPRRERKGSGRVRRELTPPARFWLGEGERLRHHELRMSVNETSCFSKLLMCHRCSLAADAWWLSKTNGRFRRAADSPQASR